MDDKECRKCKKNDTVTGISLNGFRVEYCVYCKRQVSELKVGGIP